MVVADNTVNASPYELRRERETNSFEATLDVIVLRLALLGTTIPLKENIGLLAEKEKEWIGVV
jgi:hypothetical protein